MSNSTIFKRIGAYLIDLLVITLISMIITRVSFINPKYDEYMEASEKYNEILINYQEKKIDVDEANKQVSEISYDMNKNGYVYLISDIVVVILYFGVFNFVSKGQTLGKRVMNLQIVSAKEKPLKIYNYIIRCVILNGVIMDIIILIAICFSRSKYNDIYSIGSNINMMLQIAIFLSIMFSASGRGLHDLIAGTRVIDTKAKIEEAKDKPEEIKKETEENVEIIKPQKKGKSNKKKEVKKDE